MEASQALVTSARRDFSAAQLKLIRRTLARTCSDAEFDEFVAVAAQSGLDPLRRQITPIVLNAADPERRKMIPWATIDGLRVIAARQGDYRPMETAPVIETDPARADPDRNPLGIVRAEVRVWKHRDGAWYPVAGEAWWDEYAPMRDERLETIADCATPAGGDGHRQRLEPNWMRMGRVLIAKCAEAQALRRGWPDVISGLYGEEELHALRRSEQTASERLAARNLAAEGSMSEKAWFSFDPDQGLVAVGRSELAERVSSYLRTAPTPEAITRFLERNRASMALFWEWDAEGAHRVKEVADRRLAELEARPPALKLSGEGPGGAARCRRAPRRSPRASPVSGRGRRR